MYRARVLAISGTKIFADGKWLKCIGNKNFHVGEYVWTDGRCVYGNNHIPQQAPVIITPQEHELIPIVTANGLYNFYKGKLTFIGKKEFNDRTFFVNNKKATSYLLSDAYNFLPQTEVYDEETEQNTCDLYGIFAANVDKSGNVFSIFIDGFNIFVTKNNQRLLQRDFEPCVETVKNSLDFPPAPPNPYGDRGNPQYYSGTTVSLTVSHCFIEDENNWAVFMIFNCTKNAVTSVFNDELWFEAEANKSTRYYFESGGNTSDSDEVVSGDVPPDSILRYADTPNPDKKVFLQNQYYFKEEPFLITETKYGQLYFSFYIKRTIYSPTDKKIFSGLFRERSTLIFSKVKGGFLMAVSSYDSSGYRNQLQEIDGLPFFVQGVFFCPSESAQWEILTDELCLNQKFCPVNSKHWFDKIQEFKFE